jgi:hypothetical protein
MGRARTGIAAAWLLAGLLAGCATTGDDSGDVVRPDGDATRDDAEGGSDVLPDSECPPGLSPCASGCADLTTDSANCGACGHLCGDTEVCNERECAGTCGGGRIACGTACVDPTNDPDHCGTCTNACPDGLNADGICELSACILVCRAGYQDRDGAPGCEYACSPSGTAESCNGVDDDCDGTTDEDFACAVGRSTPCTTSCGTSGSGACSPACTPPTGAACLPPAESCNGLDDDCDTVPDDGFACAPGSAGSCVTSCGSAGSRGCNVACIWDACAAPAETCNGRDDDCDGTADDGFDCPAGSTGTCSTSCGSTGTRVCNAACAWEACFAPAETCNGRDDDCDTAADEGFECVQGSTAACTASCGAGGFRTCGADCRWGACTGPRETCNGRDDDCDTVADNGFECVLGATDSCSTACGTSGSRSCSASCTWSGCSAPAESCNGADDDCDGATDEGFRAIVDTTTYGTLSGYIGPCDGSGLLIGPECNAAIHRYCYTAHSGCSSTGFGPVESVSPSVSVTCLMAPAALDPGFPTLSTFHTPCDGFTQRAGPDCNAAISRYCSSLGYVSGFGPIENSYPDAWVVCLPSSQATYIRATYTILSTYQWMCDGGYERWGTYCNSAIHNYCRALGHASGFGPVENSGDQADIVCVDS